MTSRAQCFKVAAPRAVPRAPFPTEVDLTAARQRVLLIRTGVRHRVEYCAVKRLGWCCRIGHPREIAGALRRLPWGCQVVVKILCGDVRSPAHRLVVFEIRLGFGPRPAQ